MQDTYTDTRTVSVGIWDNCEDLIACHPHFTLAGLIGVRWRGNTGNLHLRWACITGADHEAIRVALADERPDTAWDIIDQGPY